MKKLLLLSVCILCLPLNAFAVIALDANDDGVIDVALGGTGVSSYTSLKAALDLEVGVDFYSKASLDTNFGNIQANLTELYSMYTDAEIDAMFLQKENSLGNPSTNGYVLSSSTSGVRSWIALPESIDPEPVVLGGITDWPSGLDATELSYVNGVTSSIQTQLGGKEATLGNPLTEGYILSSSTAGVRSWIAPATGGGTDITGYATATPDLTSKLVGVDGSGVAKSFTTVALKTLFGTSVSLDLGALSDLKYGGVTMLDDTKGNGDIHNFWSADKVFDELALKQATLVSGTNIKRINGISVLGSGDITIVGGGGTVFPTGIDIDGGDSTASFIGDIDGGASI